MSKKDVIRLIVLMLRLNKAGKERLILFLLAVLEDAPKECDVFDHLWDFFSEISDDD